MTEAGPLSSDNRIEAIAKLEAAAERIREIGLRHTVTLRFFGSYARGTAGTGSDLDVLIMEDLPLEERTALATEIYRAGSAEDVAIDLRMGSDARYLSEESIP